MKRLRSHIVRLTVLFFICSGLGLYMAQPTKANYSSNAFADWLSKMTKSAESSNLQQELDNLRQSNDHLNKMIEKASQIVSNNNDKFSFSFTESMATQQLYQLLLVEWNQFQAGGTMAVSPIQQTTKSLLPVNVDKSLITGSVWPSNNSVQKSCWFSEQYFSSGVVFTSMIPMVNGIAIGAP